MSDPTSYLEFARVRIRAAQPDEHARCEQELATHHYLPVAQVTGDRG